MSLHEIFRKISEQDKYKRQIERSKQAFSFRPFVAEYYVFAHLVRGFRWFLGLFSIVTGFGLLYFSFIGSMHYLLAGAIAAFLLVFIELLKNEASVKSFRQMFAGGFPVLGVPALALFGLSVFLSVNGVERVYDSLDTSISTHQITGSHLVDSLTVRYEGLIESEKKALADFKQSVTWKGKLDTYNKTNASVITAYENRISTLQAEKAERLKDVQSMQAERLKTLREEGAFNRSLWWWISGLVEVSILASLLFLVYYDFRVSNEAELLSGNQERFSIGLQDMGRLMEFFSIQQDAGAIQIAAKSNQGKSQIGFNRPNEDGSGSGSLNGSGSGSLSAHSVPYSVPHSVPKISEISLKQSAYSVPHSVPDLVPDEHVQTLLIADILAGIRDYRTLMKKHRVNINTVKKAFQSINA